MKAIFQKFVRGIFVVGISAFFLGLPSHLSAEINNQCIDPLRKLTYFNGRVPIVPNSSIAHLEAALWEAKNFDQLSEAAGRLRIAALGPHSLEVTKIFLQAYQHANENSREILNVQLQGLYGDFLVRIRHLPDNAARTRRLQAIEMIENTDVLSMILDDYIRAVKEIAKQEVSKRDDPEFSDYISTHILNLHPNASEIFPTLEAEVLFKAAGEFRRTPEASVPPILGFHFEPVTNINGASTPIPTIALRALHGIERFGLPSANSNQYLNLKARYLATLALNLQDRIASEDLNEHSSNALSIFEANRFINFYLKIIEPKIKEERRKTMALQRQVEINPAARASSSTENYHAISLIELKRAILQADDDGVLAAVRSSEIAPTMASALLSTAHLMGSTDLEKALSELAKMGSSDSVALPKDFLNQSLKDQKIFISTMIEKLPTLESIDWVAKLIAIPEISSDLRTLLIRHLSMLSSVLPLTGEGLGIGLSTKLRSLATAKTLAGRMALVRLTDALAKASLDQKDLEELTSKLIDKRDLPDEAFRILIDESLLQILRNSTVDSSLKRLIAQNLNAEKSKSLFAPIVLDLSSTPLEAPVQFPIQKSDLPLMNPDQQAEFEALLTLEPFAPDWAKRDLSQQLILIAKINELVSSYTFKKPSLLWKLYEQIEHEFVAQSMPTITQIRAIEVLQATEESLRRTIEYYGADYQSNTKSQRSGSILYSAARHPTTTLLATEIISRSIKAEDSTEKTLKYFAEVYSLERQIREKMQRTLDPSALKKFRRGLQKLHDESLRIIIRQELATFRDHLTSFKEGFENGRAQFLLDTIQMIDGISGLKPDIADAASGLLAIQAYKETNESNGYFKFSPRLAAALKSSDSEIRQIAVRYANAWFRRIRFIRDFHGGSNQEVFAAKSILENFKRKQNGVR